MGPCGKVLAIVMSLDDVAQIIGVMYILQSVKAVDTKSSIQVGGKVGLVPGFAVAETEELHPESNAELLAGIALVNILADKNSGICSDVKSANVVVSVCITEVLKAIGTPQHGNCRLRKRNFTAKAYRAGAIASLYASLA